MAEIDYIDFHEPRFNFTFSTCRLGHRFAKLYEWTIESKATEPSFVLACFVHNWSSELNDHFGGEKNSFA